MKRKARPIGDEFLMTRHNGTAGDTLVILKVSENNDLFRYAQTGKEMCLSSNV